MAPAIAILLSGAGGAIASNISRFFGGSSAPNSSGFLNVTGGGIFKYILGAFALLVVWRVITGFLRWVF